MTTVDGVKISELKIALRAGTDEQLAMFLEGYALGAGADLFVANMQKPNERVGFILSIAAHYPEDWAKATEIIKKGAAEQSK